MHRFFLREGDFIRDGVFEVHSLDLAHQWRKVLKFRVGAKVVLFDGDGCESECVIELMNDCVVSGSASKLRNPGTELSFRLILATAITKQMEKFEWVLQKGTELGVSDFFPLITKRTERSMVPKIERLQRIVVEAAEQSGRVRIPRIHQIVRFDDFFEKMRDEDAIMILPHPGTDEAFSSFLHSQKSEDITIAIGPEGGFTDEEVASALKKNVQIVSLGSRVLRAETAAVVSAALVSQMWE